MVKGFGLVYIILLLVGFTSIAGGAYYLGQQSTPKITQPIPTQTQQLKTSIEPSIQKTQNPLFSGTVKKITKDLGLFNILETDKENGVSEYIVYYEAGTFTRGDFKDYTRILAIRPSEGPGPSLQFVLATKDFKTYLLDDPENKTGTYPEKDWDNPYTYLDKSKITKTVALDTEHPKIITLDKPFALIKQNSVLIESKKNGQKDKSGYDIYVDEPITQFNSEKLSSSQKQLTLYTGSTEWGNGDGYSDKEKKLLDIRKKYLHSTTFVHASDSTGLTYSYVLSSQNDIESYISKLPTYEKNVIEYKKQVALFNDKKLKDYPVYPEALPFPGMRLTQQSVKLSNTYYNTYDVAFPGACGGNQSTYIIDSLKDDDLQLIPSSSVYPLYILKDNQHPLYELALQTKTDVDDESFKSVNDGKSKPTLNEYIAKHPLLFFKDTWERWGVMGEFDIKLMGGCGKPVIYLYPEKPTAVHLSFKSLMVLNTQIPSYHNGWMVNAKPDGTLTDLQPQYTNCLEINSKQYGSEYAENACKTNIYPYIYWSGKSVQNQYPKVEEGWVVERKNLKTFMFEKLKDIGLTEKELNDMISYWIPKMSEKNTPYYRISFFLTKDMNTFIPMNVNPQPESVLRVFLDYKELSFKPTEKLAPQNLQKFSRKGFTLVEWGGLQ